MKRAEVWIGVGLNTGGGEDKPAWCDGWRVAPRGSAVLWRFSSGDDFMCNRSHPFCPAPLKSWASVQTASGNARGLPSTSECQASSNRLKRVAQSADLLSAFRDD